jgi:uncharacterized membrane protein (UPF0127 family)
MANFLEHVLGRAQSLGLLCSLFLGASLNARDLDKLYRKDSFAFDKKEFVAYVADTERLRADGLMFIEKLPENTGMLFVFENPQPLNFWMKNTLIPLSIGFIDEKGKLIDIQEMKVGKSLMDLDVPTYQSRGSAVFALEMSTGWYKKNSVKIGTELRLVKPSNSLLLNKQLPPAKSSGH